MPPSKTGREENPQPAKKATPLNEVGEDKPHRTVILTGESEGKPQLSWLQS